MNEKNEKFIIARYVNDFIILLDDYLLNYPKKYFELRNRLVMDSYNLLELIYEANYSEKNERKKLQINALMKVNLIDFYIEESFKKKIISEKQSIKMSTKLLGISKMIYKWVNENESENN